MAKKLINCLPPQFASELRSELGLKDNAFVANDKVLNYMRAKGNSTVRAADNAKLSALAYQRTWSEVMDYRNAKGEPDPKAGLKALLYTDRKEMFGGASLEAKMDAIAAGAHRELSEMIVKFAPQNWGLKRSREFQDGLVRSLFGEQDVDNMYSRFGDAWNKLNERLIERYNRTGAELEFNSKDLPIESDYRMIKAFGSYKEWYMSIKNDLDFRAMGIDPDGGFIALHGFYQDIVTDGIYSRTMDTTRTENPFQKRYHRQRHLKFRTADGWLKYSKNFSKETPYSAMMDHITHITKEIGIREQFGPTPDSTFRNLKNAVVVNTGDKKAGIFAEKVYKNITMDLNPTNPTMANSFQTARNLITGTKLTFATLSALPDTIYSSMTARYNGISATKTMKRFVGTLTEMSRTSIQESQQIAARTGFLLEHALDSLHATSRFGDVAGKNMSSMFSEAVMRGTGLNRWTVAGKQAFHMEFMSLLATDFSGNKRLTASFKRYGINESDLVKIRNADTVTHRGVEYLDPYSLDEKLTEKVVAMVKSETRYAVPEPDAAVQAIMNQGYSRGEFGGEFIRSAGQFKAFSASIIMSHVARSMHGFEGNWGGKARYAASLITGATMLGGLAVQMKEMAKGNKPRDTDNAKFLVDSMLAGGVFSIAGDLVLSDMSKFGSSFMDYLGGPLGGEASKLIWDGLFGNAHAIAAADDKLLEISKIVSKTSSEAINYIPGQFWYTRLAFDRILYDDLHKAADPSWEIKQMNREIKRRQETGANERWWK